MVITAFECQLVYEHVGLPAKIICSTSFFITTWALPVANIVIVTKTISTYDLKGTIWKKLRHRWRIRDGGCRSIDEAGVRRVGVAMCEGGGDGVEAIVEAVRAGRIGDIGSAGGAGKTDVGEPGKVSDRAGGVSNTMVSCVDDRWRDDGVADSDIASLSGTAGLERGERRSSLSPRSNSASLRRFLTHLAGGGFASGGKGGGGVAADVVHNRGAFSQAVTVASGDGVAADVVHNRGAFSQAGTAASGDGGCGHN